MTARQPTAQSPSMRMASLAASREFFTTNGSR